MVREYFEEPYSHKSDEETVVDIECEEPIKGTRRVVTRVVVESESSNIGSIRIYVKRGRILFPVWEQLEAQDETLYWTKRDIVVFHREKILVRFNGVHDDDVFNVTEFGYHEEA